MKRLARLGLATGLAATLLLPFVKREAAFATPFSDVPANHWAYQYIQSLAADGIIDGYPNGKFKGDRPLTRYEMATVVARVIAKLQENTGKGPSKEDLDKLQKLIDALKDELDALGVRVTNLEDSLDALDKRTKFAQSLSMHGVFTPNISLRQRPTTPRTITNTTGAPVTTYYGAVVPGGSAANPTAVAAIDPFLLAFLASDDSNSPLTFLGTGVRIRQDSRFSLSYAISDNLTLSLPVHVLNFSQGGEFTQQQAIDLEPGVDVNIAKTGNITNLHLKYGIIDDMQPSRIGLAFRPPQGYNGAIPYELPIQPFQKGAEISGSIGEGAFGVTDFVASFTRLDQTLINTQNAITDPNVSPNEANGYFFPIVPPSGGLTQTGAANKTDTFNSGTGTLAQVFLTSKAQAGSVYISYYNGATFSNVGVQTGGPATGLPNFTYNDAYNDVVFGSPVPAGAVVQITYRPLGRTANTNFQRYMAHARLNQKFKGYPGLEVGLNYNRIFDFDDTQTTGSGANGLTNIGQSPVTGNGAVSDTVLGLDFQLPLPFLVSGKGSNPVLFGEAASSKFTSDFRNVAAVGDTAGVFGVKVKVQKVELSAQYQSVGANFFVGAPFRYFGNPPPLFAFYKLDYLPDFFGFGSNLGINTQFDNQFTNIGLKSPNTVGNPNLTFSFPLYNTLKAAGPSYFSNFAPNSRGITASVNTPIRIGDFNLTARGSYQHLEEIRPNSLGSLLYGPSYATTERQKFDTYGLGTSFKLPVFGQAASVNLNGSYETLKRNDTKGFAYYPINPTTQTFDGTAFAQAANPAGLGGSKVSFYPNYVNVRHITYAANVALPLTKDLVGSVTYNTQRYGGSYGTTINQNISERKDYYTGAVTYNIPKTNSSVSVGARRFQYTDDVIPNTNYVLNRQDLNFTVRF